jgi:hypothetical protein
METENNEKIEGEETPVKGNDIKVIAESIIGRSPSVSNHVIEQEQEKGTTDIDGINFDPSIHVSDANGNPVKTAAGRYRNKSGRKPGVNSNTQKPASQLNIGGKTTQEPDIADGTILAGKAAACMIFQAGCLIGGDEWQPVIDPNIGRNEPQEMEAAFISYFKAKGITDFPPGVVLALTIFAYAAPRFVQPKTKTRLQMIGLWIKSKIPRRKMRPENSPEMPKEKEAVQ